MYHGVRTQWRAARERLLYRSAFYSCWRELGDSKCNITETIAGKIGANLHRKRNHPLCIIKKRIESYFQSLPDKPTFATFDNLSPFVSTYDCFDAMLVPMDHQSRSVKDTYYLNASTVLRTHTSAHEMYLMKNEHRAWLLTGDVYRRDAIDASHYPVFHQMEGVRCFPNLYTQEESVLMVKTHLKKTLEGMVIELFGPVETRWVDAYFPFTDPSFELEILFKGEWLEVLGCGVLQQEILRNAGVKDTTAWAFGLGLERLAMILFNIPDIRLFWSKDERFLTQFHEEKKEMQFKSYSKFPVCYKDVSFWHEEHDFNENDLFELVRDVARDVVEKVVMVDSYQHPEKKRQSKCFRIIYRHMDRNLTNAEVDTLQSQVRDRLEKDMKVELR